MKEFDYEKAKAGAPVCTREGRPVRIVCWDALNVVFDVKYPIIGLIEERDVEYPATYTIDGHARSDREDPDDLMMASVKHEGYVLIDPEGPHCIAHIYNSKEEAEEDAEREIIAYSAIAHIEWEDE